MSEWHDSQKKPSGNFRKLLQERLDKDNPRRKKLTREETTKLAKLEGIASKCVRSIVGYGISELSLKKINSGYYDLNIGSAKVLEKCGFNVEGEKLSDVIFEGKRINSILVGYVP